MATVWGAVQYIASKAAKTGLTVTVDVWALPIGNLAGKSEVATAQAAAEIGDGFYAFEYASADPTANRYAANFHTADATVDRQDIGVWMVSAADYAEPGDQMALADDAITADKFDQLTAFPLESADSGSTAVARTGADADTLETLSDQIDVAQDDLDSPDQYKADVSALALEATAQAILADTGTDGVVVATASKSEYALSAVAIDAILDEVIENGQTLRQLIRIAIAALVGDYVRSAGSVAFRDLADTKDRIVATMTSTERDVTALDGT